MLKKKKKKTAWKMVPLNGEGRQKHEKSLMQYLLGKVKTR